MQLTLAWFLWPNTAQAFELESEVTVWIEPGKAVATSRRTLVFGSRLSGWEEFE